MNEPEKPVDGSNRNRTENRPKEEIDRLVQGVDDIYFGGAESAPDDTIGRYTEFKADRLGVSFAVAADRSMTRLIGQIQANREIVVIITAFQQDKDLQHNRGANVCLAGEIRSLGWGYTPVTGFWMKKGEGCKAVHFREEVLFAFTSNHQRPVTKNVRELLEKYHQSAALMRLPNQQETILLSNDGSFIALGPWPATPGAMAEYYASMRSRPKDGVFKFEAAGDNSVMTRWAVAAFFKNKGRQATSPDRTG